MKSQEVLEQWLAEEHEVLHRLRSGTGPGVAPPDDIKGLSGSDILRNMMNGVLPYAECAQSLSFCAIKIAPEYALFQGTTMRGQLNPMGTIHGGWMSSILDSALGCAVLSSLPAGQVYSTTSLDIRFRKFLTLATPRVRAEARLLQTEGSRAFADACLYGPDGTIYADGSAICRIAEIRGNP